MRTVHIPLRGTLLQCWSPASGLLKHTCFWNHTGKTSHQFTFSCSLYFTISTKKNPISLSPTTLKGRNKKIGGENRDKRRGEKRGEEEGKMLWINVSVPSLAHFLTSFLGKYFERNFWICLCSQSSLFSLSAALWFLAVSAILKLLSVASLTLPFL